MPSLTAFSTAGRMALASCASTISAAKDVRAMFPPVGTWPRDSHDAATSNYDVRTSRPSRESAKDERCLAGQHLLAHEQQQRDHEQAADRHGAEVVEVADHRGLPIDLGIPHREHL